MIHAPAGYGKTSLLSQWRRRLEARNVRIAWLTLEREDADVRRLADYIAFALSDRTVRRRGRRLSSLPARAALSVIVNEIARDTRPLLLILDDLH